MKPLSGQELDRLELMLDANDLNWEAMPLDMLQGFLCGVASLPMRIPPEEWLPWALGIDPWPETHPEAAAWFDLLVRYYHQQVRALEGAEDAALMFYEDTQHVSTKFEHWCVGFVEPFEIFEIPPGLVRDPAELDELLFPLRVLANALEENERARIADKEWARLQEECATDLWPAVVDTFKYGTALRNRPTTIKREAPKIGRNGPCPCGSGKKFKNCCIDVPGGTD